MRAKLSVVDLFAGAGGLSEGFRQAGFSVRAGCELDPDASATYRTPSREPSHTAKIVPGSLLAAIVGASHIEVNSTHHQAVKDPGRAKVSAVALDQVVEAIELPGRFALGVQWHPELIGSHEHLALYRALVDRARR